MSIQVMLPDPRPDSAPVCDGRLFIGRQPILDSHQCVVAYELLFRASATARTAEPAYAAAAEGRLLIDSLNQLGIDDVLGSKTAHVNVSYETLFSDAVETLPADRLMLEVNEATPPTTELLARCRALHAAGYRFALDNFVYRRELEPLIALADVVKFDALALGPERIWQEIARLRGRHLKFVISKVETREVFRVCRVMGAHYFQGFYFARPETLGARRMDPQLLRVARVFNLVSSGAGMKRIEAELSHDVTLSFSLLRYINSPEFGLVAEISSVHHAVVVLGHNKLAKWLSLAMLGGSPEAPRSHALFRAALARARLLELLGHRRLSDADGDRLFLVGMFSLLEALVGMPMKKALADLDLPAPVYAALADRCGPYAAYVDLAEACERANAGRMVKLAVALGIEASEIAVANLEALKWADQVGG